MAPQPSARASDDDRDRVARRLRQAYAVGRLTAEELDERLDAVLRARTYAELDALTADLPEEGAPPAARPAAAPPEHHPGHAAMALRSWASTALIVWGVWLAILLTGGGLQGLWPVWVTVPWGAVILARWVRGDEH